MELQVVPVLLAVVVAAVVAPVADMGVEDAAVEAVSGELRSALEVGLAPFEETAHIKCRVGGAGRSHARSA